MDYDNKTGMFSGLLLFLSYLDEGFQADALPIVEQIRDYKDARYVLRFACKNLTIPMCSRSGTRLGAILDATPDMDSKLNFPQAVGTRFHIDHSDYSQ